MKNFDKMLIYGFGNPGRQDDGLGPAFAEMADEWKTKNDYPGIHVDSNYQLNIEDALLISEFDAVIFADATVEEDIKDFVFAELDPSNAEVKYTLHAASPGYIVKLCNDMYNKFPETFILKIRGYEWELKEGLTTGAQDNLKKAFEFMIRELTGR